MFENFYIKNGYEKMNIIWVIVIKITFECKITKNSMSLYYIFLFFYIIILFLKYLNKFSSKKDTWINYINVIINKII